MQTTSKPRILLPLIFTYYEMQSITLEAAAFKSRGTAAAMPKMEDGEACAIMDAAKIWLF